MKSKREEALERALEDLLDLPPEGDWEPAINRRHRREARAAAYAALAMPARVT